ncbi:MAG: alpha/beta fold hydrolase [Beijerinckiaceae bacterium]
MRDEPLPDSAATGQPAVAGPAVPGADAAQLWATPGNAVPDGAQVAWLFARDGVRLRAAHWPARGDSVRGTVLLMQGRAEFIEKYFEVVEELRGRGFHVATLDWRGQGGSQRLTRDARRGHVRRFSDFGLDVQAFVAWAQAENMPQPWFGLAHSMGGAIALTALHGKRLPVERLVTTAPMIGIATVPQPNSALWLARSLRALGRGKSYVPGGGATSIATRPFKGNPLSSDPLRYARNADVAGQYPHLAIGDPTIGWVAACFGQMKIFAGLRYPLEILTPVLVIAAGADDIVSTPAVERFALRLKAGSAITLPGARHEILMENDALRSQFWAAFDAFVPGSALPEQLENFSAREDV